MSAAERLASFIPSASQYILDNFRPTERIAMLVLNRDSGAAIQRITSAQKAASPEFQAWLRYKNASGSDIYIGMNPLRQDARTRTKQDIDSIRHLYLDLDHGGSEAVESVENSSAVPKPNYVLTSSPDKFQVVWKVEGVSLDEAEAVLHAMAREFGADPAATDATRVLRLPGFANKKYRTDFCVEARRESSNTYHLRDFKLQLDSQQSPRRIYDNRAKREPGRPANLSQSEHDWAFAKRALARGEQAEQVIRQIARHRAAEKSNPEDYAKRTVTKAQAELASKGQESESPGEQGIREPNS
jgi:hypothetical protein